MIAMIGCREGKNGWEGCVVVGREWRSESSFERNEEIMGSGQLQNRWDKESACVEHSGQVGRLGSLLGS